MDLPAPWAHQLTRWALLRTGTSAVLGAAATADGYGNLLLARADR